jgi:prepilin-type N-terminal cleavage/methylation domain-containing protein
MPNSSIREQGGMSLLELLVVLTILGLLVGIAPLFLKPLEQPLRTGGQLLEGQIRATRARAAATMTVHRVRPTAPGALTVETSTSCSSGTWTPEPDLALGLPRDVTLTDTTWTLCFGTRGTTATGQTIVLSHPEQGTLALEVLVGGLVRWP